MNYPQINSKKENILIIDDNHDSLNFLSRILSKQGYKVRPAPNGQLALLSIPSSLPDLILLDIMMPKMDGYEVCKQLKASPTTQDIPVIFISALDEVFDKVKAFEVGGVDYITKPFEIQEVLARVENQLRIRRLSKQILDQNARLTQELEERNRVEAALRESQRWLSAITETNPNMLYVYDLIEQQPVYSNREIYTFLGYKLEEVQQMGTAVVQNLMHPDDLAVLPENIKRFETAADGEFFENEYRLRHKNGEYRWFYSRDIVFARNTDGKPKQILGAATDITQQKRVEEELRQQKELLQTIFDHIPVMVDFYDAKGKIQLVNRELERVLGWSKAELENVDLIAECYPDPKQRQQALQQMIAATGKWQDFKVRTRDGSYVDTSWANIRLSDGTSIGIGQDITERKQAEEALRQQFQREQLHRAIAQRIHQSLNLEEILNETVAQVQQVLDCEQVLVYRVWPDGTGSVVTAVVPGFCAIVGQTFPKEVIPQESHQLFCTGGICAIANVDVGDIPSNKVELAQQFGVKALLEVPIFQGTELWGLLVAQQCSCPRQWQQFEIDLLCSLTDTVAIAIQQAELYEHSRAATHEARTKAQQLEQALAELTRTQAQLVQIEKMASLGQLVAGVAHEINNPTSFIYGNIAPATEYAQDLLHLLQLYRRHYPEPDPEITQLIEGIDPDFIAEDFPKLLASMKEGANRIRQIVLSLKNFSRLDERDYKQVDIHEGIDSTLLILQHRLKQHPHHPEIQVIKEYGELPLLKCYPAQLNQVFMNILSNAIDALEMGTQKQENNFILASSSQSLIPNPQSPIPTIWIRTEVTKGAPDYASWVTIRIADNGSGMSEEVLQKIFDPFFTTKPVGSGTGLGLWISYQIVVDKHGGQLSCHSVAGQGTEFAISLPIVQGHHLGKT